MKGTLSGMSDFEDDSFGQESEREANPELSDQDSEEDGARVINVSCQC